MEISFLFLALNAPLRSRKKPTLVQQSNASSQALPHQVGDDL